MLKAFLKKPLKVRVLRGFLLSAVLGLALVVTPTPYRLEAPGKAMPVEPMIVIGKAELYRSEGAFLLPTILSEKATLLYCLYALLNPDAVLLDEPRVQPQAQTPGQAREMALSQYLSAVVALEAAGYKLQGEFLGLRILDVAPNSPNREELRRGDTLIRIGEEELNSFQDFKKALQERPVGEPFSAVVIREGNRVSISLQTFAVDNKPMIGVMLRPEVNPSQFPFPIEFRSGSTVGGSGGLVFALEIYNRLTPEDITRGKVVAATGTLDQRGRVGPIGGINFKLSGAAEAGANTILVPAENWSEIRAVPAGLEVIPVANFNDALDALKK